MLKYSKAGIERGKNMRNLHRRKMALGEAGLVSVTVTLVFVAVISLIVLGFSQVSQRNSKLALDRELSTQAYYAAETAINDTLSKIAQMADAGQTPPTQTDCADSTKYTKNNGAIEGSEPNIKYTCLLVNPTPDDLEITSLTDASVILPLHSTVGSLDDFTLEWASAENAAPSASLANCQAHGNDSNIAAGTWANQCQFGVLRVDVVPNKADVLGNANAAAAKTMTMYIYPRAGGDPIPEYQYHEGDPSIYAGFATGAPQGRVGIASCTARVCRAKITGLAFPSAYLRVKSIYQDAPNFRVFRGAGETFSGGQVEIDVTAKAQDVLRRLRVKASISGNSSKNPSDTFTEYGLATRDSICKSFNTSPRLGNNTDASCVLGD